MVYDIYRAIIFYGLKYSLIFVLFELLRLSFLWLLNYCVRDDKKDRVRPFVLLINDDLAANLKAQLYA